MGAVENDKETPKPCPNDMEIPGWNFEAPACQLTIFADVI